MYLFDAALGDAEQVDDVARDQYHGRQSHEPANHLAPQRVHILPQGQRGHLNGTEGKHPLQYTVKLVSPCYLWLVSQKQNELANTFGHSYVDRYLIYVIYI